MNNPVDIEGTIGKVLAVEAAAFGEVASDIRMDSNVRSRLSDLLGESMVHKIYFLMTMDSPRGVHGVKLVLESVGGQTNEYVYPPKDNV